MNICFESEWGPLVDSVHGHCEECHQHHQEHPSGMLFSRPQHYFRHTHSPSTLTKAKVLTYGVGRGGQAFVLPLVGYPLDS